MKNNTAYLKNIHWVALLATAYGLFSIYVSPWLYGFFKGENAVYASIILSVFYFGITYAGIGMATSRWKELIISFIVAEALFITYFFAPGNETGMKAIIYFFIIPVPLTIFICQVIGWDKRVIIVYLGIMLAGLVLTMTSFENGAFFRLTRLLRTGHSIWTDLLTLLYIMTTKVFHVIIICELLNYLRSENKKPKPLLLNLGNEYNRLNSFIAFWVMKTALLLIAFGSAGYLRMIMESTSRRYGGFGNDNEGWKNYIMTVGIVRITGSILLALFTAWYLRKLLLEYFITYDVRSKFLYWLALVPFIGFLSFLFMETNEEKQRNYNQKIESMGNFAASSTAAISTIAFILLFLRLVVRLSNTGPGVVLSIVLATLLFTWMMYSQVAYYLNGVVILLAMAAILVYSFMTSYAPEEMLMYFALLIFGLTQLILSLPVYHFDKFFYTPSENPEPEEAGPRDIFA
jgi:hypothetical protein